MTTTRTIANSTAPFLTPGGVAIAGAVVTFTLVDVNGQPIDGWDSVSNERIVGAVSATTDNAGKFSLVVVPNDRIGPTTTYYLVTVSTANVSAFYVQIPTGAAITWEEVFEMGVGTISGAQLSNTYARIDAIEGGSTITDARLIEWVAAEAYQPTTITFDNTYPSVVSSAVIAWPDGAAGILTVDAINTSWLTVDAFHLTHSDSGKTITQAAVTRNTDGNITIKPELTVA